MTVAELRELLEDYPDDLPVTFASPVAGERTITGARVHRTFPTADPTPYDGCVATESMGKVATALKEQVMGGSKTIQVLELRGCDHKRDRCIEQ